jgi:hypothetical protein
MFRVPLDELYKVIDSCVFDPINVFCPVLLQIKDPQILEENDRKEYLLQVWSNRGEMIFERALEKPISNWNISTDKFLFQEADKPSTIFLLKLELEKRSTLFELQIPQADFDDMLTRGARAETEAAGLQPNTDGNIPKLLDFIDGYLVLAIEQQIFYAPIAQLGLKSEYENEDGK